MTDPASVCPETASVNSGADRIGSDAQAFTTSVRVVADSATVVRTMYAAAVIVLSRKARPAGPVAITWTV